MNWAIDKLHIKRREWQTLFNLCLKYKQFDLLKEYWKIIEEEEQ